MSKIEFVVGDKTYTGTLLEDEAPESIAAMRDFLPLESEIQHVRWSGYAGWVNIDDVDLPDIPRENHTVYPSRGDVLLYPGYRNEKEILIACGPTCFKSPAGELAGNHVAILDATREELAALEVSLLKDGAQDITVRIK
ncbi:MULTISPECIES: DUF3830 family protein [unclassified Haladaptatus]|uniref:DUF3830 family protein n=1 Tax=unclassified Haladaptatus TaxID=2622732 RepID=UPI0023E8B83E|nr:MULTISPECIES: DUF3830 family protein [unclassified Haladaptatus]